MASSRRYSHWLFLILTVAQGWSANRAPSPKHDEMAPLFHLDSTCGADAAWGLWSPEAHGCFQPGGIWIESRRSRVDIEFFGASSTARPVGLEPAGARISSIKGNDSGRWTSAQAYGVVRYKELYPGVDLIYSAAHTRLKSEFYIQPGADPSSIHLRYSGSPKLDSSGNLLVESERGTLREDAPVAYQEIGGVRVPVEAAFFLEADGMVAFNVGAYDPEYLLVIDPVLTFSTVFGGFGYTTINSTAVDANGNIYFAGCTDSTVSPIVKALQSIDKGSNEAFVGKVGPDGKLLYATYLGGTGSDCATGIAVDSGGAAIVTGWTSSRDFPIASAYQPSLRGGRDAFVARLSAQGDRLLFSTYFGGLMDDMAYGVAVDGSGNAYITGQTYSLDFPVRNALQPRLAGGTDAFLAEFTATGNLVYSTFYGGSFDDSAKAVTVSADGVASIAGATQSLDLPTVGAIQNRNGGGQDAFVAQFGKLGANIRYATYLGGSGGSVGAPEFATSIALDYTGAAYVTGVTSSPNFPTVRALFPSPRGGTDAFVAKLSPSGSQLVYSTYLGGASIDMANGIAVDAAGNAYVAGTTWSQDFPATAPLMPRKWDYDVFITELDANGASLLLSVFIAGSASDSANSIALDSAGNIYVAGQTFSMDIPLVNAFGAPTGSSQGMLAEISRDNVPSPVSTSPASGSGYSQQFTVTSSDPAGGSDLLRTYVTFSAAGSSAQCSIIWLAPNGLYLLNDSMTDYLRSIVPGTNDSIENSQCRINAASSSVVNSGSLQTLILDLYFKPAFAGTKNITVLDQTKANLTASRVLGTWAVTVDPAASSLQPVSVNPASGSGSSGQFVVTSSDPAGASDLVRTYVTFSAAGSSASCYIVWLAGNGIYLLNDSMTDFLRGIVPGASDSVENSQCRINAASSSAVNSGNTQALTLDLYFKPAFAGTKNIMVLDQTKANQTSASRVLGTWTVTADPVPSALQPVSVNPASGSGYNGQFVVTSSDPAGASDLMRTYVTFSAAGSSASCYIVWLAGNGIYLLNDGMTDFLRGVVPGASDSVENSQCRINAASSWAVNSGNTQTLTLGLTFKPAFAGTKNITILDQTKANQTSASRVLGTWTVSQ
jgi:hypothetical protein